MDEKRLQTAVARLRSAVPLLGTIWRRSAARELAEDKSPATIPHLIWALQCSDEETRQIAETALNSLSNEQSVNALCDLWAKERGQVLGAIVRKCRYIASKPTELRVLTGLWVGNTEAISNPADVGIAAGLLQDKQAEVRTLVRTALVGLKNPKLVDAVCDQAISNPAGDAARICLEKGFRPRDPERASLFLCVTRQTDAFFAEDPDFHHLRLEYDRADTATQSRVMEVIRSGDRRWLTFLGTRKALSECSAEEIQLVIDSCLRHADWSRLWRYFLDLPLQHSYPLITKLRESGWQPTDPDQLALFHAVLAEGNGSAPSLAPPASTNPVFGTWLARGRQGELAALSEAELVTRLQKADPPEGVAIAAALGSKCRPGSPGAKAVMESGHWMVRLAGHAVGLVPPDPVRDAPDDGNHWVRELVQARGLLDIWPVHAGPAGPDLLEQLDNAPAEAWLGQLGTVRKVFRSLLLYGNTTPILTERVDEAAEDTGIFDEIFEEIPNA